MLRVLSITLALLSLSVPSARAAVCFGTDMESNSATLYLYDAGGDYCPDEYAEHDGVALTCKRHGETHTDLEVELYFFVKTKVGELWVADNPLSIQFRQGTKSYVWEEDAISLQTNDFVGGYVYLIYSPLGLPRALAEMLMSGQDIEVEAPGESAIVSMKNAELNARKFVDYCFGQK
jgi:hypothetical protein